VNKIGETEIIPILMCGGSGSRLWPMSRESLPKQFLKCKPNDNHSFLQDTFLRLRNLKNLNAPILISNEKHRFIVAEQMREIDVEPAEIILEPYARNTTAAIALGALKAESINSNSVCLILPTDHAVNDIQKFTKLIYKGLEFANKGSIVTFGINPTSAETGFGYIEAQKNFDFNKPECIPIEKFIEKPNKAEAEKLILNNKYLWNSGIFLVRTDVLINEIKNLASNVFLSCKDAIKKSSIDLDFLRIDKNSFNDCPSIPFDIAIMEKTKIGFVLPLDIEWSDLGSWDSYWKICKKDKFGNSFLGNIFAKDVNNCFLKSESKLIVGLDIDNLIVVESNDAVLVTKKGASQEIKDIVELMKARKIKEATSHRKIYRPWGTYLTIADGESWQVKTISVNPFSALSLQKHKFRSEHWIIVSGLAEVTVDNNTKLLKDNESTYIPLGTKHRLSNPTDKPLILIEVQSGTYLGEDDIIRFKDNYGRNN
tara:strand:- start:67 stop:1515 length:1449 start_codon:yes stop_codon:yes gene_type:complete